MKIVISSMVVYSTILVIATWVMWTMFYVNLSTDSPMWWIGDVIVNRSIVIAMLLITSFTFFDFTYRLFAYSSAIYAFWLCSYEVRFIMFQSGMILEETTKKDFHFISVIWFLVCSIFLIMLNVSKRNRV